MGRIANDEAFMCEALQKAEAFYFNKFLSSLASYLTIHPSSCDVLTSSDLCWRIKKMSIDNSSEHRAETLIAQKAVGETNSRGNMTWLHCVLPRWVLWTTLIALVLHWMEDNCCKRVDSTVHL